MCDWNVVSTKVEGRVLKLDGWTIEEPVGEIWADLNVIIDNFLEGVEMYQKIKLTFKYGTPCDDDVDYLYKSVIVNRSDFNNVDDVYEFAPALTDSEVITLILNGTIKNIDDDYIDFVNMETLGEISKKLL